MSGGFQPSSALLHQAGATFVRDFRPRRRHTRSVAGVGTRCRRRFRRPRLDHIRNAGKTGKALEASRAVGHSESVTDLTALKHSLREAISAYRRRSLITPAPVHLAAGPRQFVCYCEDVLAKDVVQGVDEGFRDVQMLKRYSTVTMGPCQGKMCHKRFTEILASEIDASLTEVGSTDITPARPAPHSRRTGRGHAHAVQTNTDSPATRAG